MLAWRKNHTNEWMSEIMWLGYIEMLVKVVPNIVWTGGCMPPGKMVPRSQGWINSPWITELQPALAAVCPCTTRGQPQVMDEAVLGIQVLPQILGVKIFRNSLNTIYLTFSSTKKRWSLMWRSTWAVLTVRVWGGWCWVQVMIRVAKVMKHKWYFR